MANCQPTTLPWLPSFQMCSDPKTIYTHKRLYTKSAKIETESNNQNAKNEISFQNNVEAYWDHKILGQLSCKRGSLRESLGKFQLSLLTFILLALFVFSCKPQIFFIQ